MKDYIVNEKEDKWKGEDKRDLEIIDVEDGGIGEGKKFKNLFKRKEPMGEETVDTEKEARSRIEKKE